MLQLDKMKAEKYWADASQGLRNEGMGSYKAHDTISNCVVIIQEETLLLRSKNVVVFPRFSHTTQHQPRAPQTAARH